MKPENCPSCNANSEWIEEEAWGDWICGNCDTIIKNEQPAARPASGLIVRKKDAATLAVEANIKANQEKEAACPEYTEEELTEALKGAYRDRIWSR